MTNFDRRVATCFRLNSSQICRIASNRSCSYPLLTIDYFSLTNLSRCWNLLKHDSAKKVRFRSLLGLYSIVA